MATVPSITATPDEARARSLEPQKIDEAVRAFQASGTLAMHGVFERSYIDRLSDFFLAGYRRDFEDPLRRNAENVGDKRNLIVVEVEGVLNDPELYANPLTLPVFQRLLGEQCIVGQYGSVTSLPGAQDQRPHRDSPWLFDDPALDPALPCYAITVVVPLIDMHVDGPGTTRVWPGTHRMASDDDAAAAPSNDPVLPRGSCLLMDSRLRHGGTGNQSSGPRPILYMSYQRHWFRDYDGYNKKPPIHISAAELAKVPSEVRHLFAWALADNTPETLERAIKRLAKRAVPRPIKSLLRTVLQRGGDDA